MTSMDKGSLLRRMLLCHLRQTTLSSRRAINNAGPFLVLFLLYALLFILWVATP